MNKDEKAQAAKKASEELKSDPSLQVRDMLEKYGLAHSTYYKYRPKDKKGKGGRFIPEETLKKAIELYDSGSSCNQAANTVGISCDTLSKRLNDLGKYEFRQSSRKDVKERYLKVKEYIAEGANVTDACRKARMCVNTYKRWRVREVGDTLEENLILEQEPPAPAPAPAPAPTEKKKDNITVVVIKGDAEEIRTTLGGLL